MKLVLLALCIACAIAQDVPPPGPADPLNPPPGGVGDLQNQPPGGVDDQTNQQPDSGYPQNQLPGTGYDPMTQLPGTGYDPMNQQPGAGYDPMNQQSGTGYFPQNQLPRRNYPHTNLPGGGYDPLNQQPGGGYPPMNQQPGVGYPPRNQPPGGGYPPRNQQSGGGYPPTNAFPGLPGFLGRMQMPSLQAHHPRNFFHSFQKHMDTHFLPPGHKCVKPYNLTEELGFLSTTTQGYPQEAIASEIGMRADLSLYLPSAQPTTNDNVYNVDYSFSCPTITRRLISFRRYGGSCWILSDVPRVNFGYCAESYCKNHQYGSTLSSRDMCVEHFDSVLVWAYCDNYDVADMRIRHEIIKISKYCTCKNVKCY